jgi:polysaccharide biosynthesis protein PslH
MARNDLRDRPRGRLLFLSQTLPYPPDGGVRIRSFHILRMLCRAYDVSALCFYRASVEAGEDQVRGLCNELRRSTGARSVEAFPIPQEASRLRFLWDHLRSVVTGRSYTVFTYESAWFRRRLEELLQGEPFDLVHLESLDLSGYLESLPRAPIVCDHHNVESVLLERRAEREGTPLRRGYLAHQGQLLRREEGRWCPRVDLNLTVSTEDRRLLLDRAPGSSITVVPNGVDTSAFQPAYGGDRGIVFVGGHTWFPNRDGMEYFAQEILPLLTRRIGTIPVRWVGRAPDALVTEYRDRFGIEMTGYVENIRPHVAPAACFVVPLRVGGGTRLKILDAWAMGKAVVSTPEGCEGLEVEDGENILIRSDPESFATAVEGVLRDESLRIGLGKGARATVERLYDWDVVGRDLLEELASLPGRDVQPGRILSDGRP